MIDLRGVRSMASVKVERGDFDAAQLRAEAARATDAKKARRILTIAMVLDGHPRLLAAKASAMDRQTLRDWVHRYNAEGLAGLSDRPRCGRKPQLTAEQMKELDGWVQAGPDPKADGVVRWPGFAVTGHTRRVAMSRKPRNSWVFAAATIESEQKS